MDDTSNKGLSIKANMAWNAAGSIVYLVSQWLITVLVVRLSSGYDAAGLLALGMAVSNVFTPIGYYKVRAFQVSDLSNEFSFNQYLGFRIVTIVISLLIMVVYGALTCPLNTLNSVFLYGIYSVGPVFVDVLHGEDQKCSRMDGIGKSLVLRGIFSLVSFVVGMIVTGSLDISLILMIISTFSVIVLYDIRFMKGATGCNMHPSFDRSVMKALFIKCLPLVVALFFSSAAPVIPRQTLSDMWGESALGIYASVASPVLIVQMCAQYLYTPLLTKFAELYSESKIRAFVILLLKVSLGILSIAVVLGIGLMLFGQPIFVLIYGSSIAPYVYLLGPLVICTAMVAYIWCLGDILIVMRRNVDNLIGYGIVFVASVILMNYFVSTFDMNGVSFTLICAYSFGLIYFCLRILFVASRQGKDAMQNATV